MCIVLVGVSTPSPHTPHPSRHLQRGGTAATWAICKGPILALRMLLAAGANPAKVSGGRGRRRAKTLPSFDSGEH